jgi:hypothetical protein
MAFSVDCGGLTPLLSFQISMRTIDDYGKLFNLFRCSVMKSVPPRGSGWVSGFFDFRLPIGFIASRQLEIGNGQSAMTRPTRYREVVLTSSPPRDLTWDA